MTLLRAVFDAEQRDVFRSRTLNQLMKKLNRLVSFKQLEIPLLEFLPRQTSLVIIS